MSSNTLTESAATRAKAPSNESGHSQGNGAGNGAPSLDRLMQMAWGYAPAIILQSALEHRVFDFLETSPATAEQVAAQTKTSPRGMRILLDALTGLNFLEKKEDRYTLTPESAAFLVSTRTGYFGAFLNHTVRQLIPCWMQLSDVVRTGKPALPVNQQKTGSDFFVAFVESLFPLSYPVAKTLAEHLGLRNLRNPVSALDIGAGSGVWGIALAEASPAVRIHAVDWPNVLEITRKVFARHGLAERLNCAAGDLLEADFGSGHLAATIGHIFHSEGVERSKKLIRRTYEALAPGGTIAIAEWVPNEERTGPPGALMFAVNMLVHTDQGDTYTFGEMSEWLTEAGFVDPRMLDVAAPCPLILATKPRD